MTLLQFRQNIMTSRSNPEGYSLNNQAMKTWTYTSWHIREYCYK